MSQGERNRSTEPCVPDFQYRWDSGIVPSTPGEIADFFQSREITVLKERLVDIGRRLWERAYVDGNGGNITIRVGDDLVLTTPTLISKGFMQPTDMCLVNLRGEQLAGERKRTSEVKTHLGIMRAQPGAKACVHAHPVHATAFAVASLRPPTGMIPEVEVFVGEIALAPYETPGSREVAEIVGRAAVDHNAILMENHGVITWGTDVEDAYWKMENVDAYCRTVWVASHLGSDLKTYSPEQLRTLIALRESLGMKDPRSELPDSALCDNRHFRPAVDIRTDAIFRDDEFLDTLVDRIANRVVEKIARRKA